MWPIHVQFAIISTTYKFSSEILLMPFTNFPLSVVGCSVIYNSRQQSDPLELIMTLKTGQFNKVWPWSNNYHYEDLV